MASSPHFDDERLRQNFVAEVAPLTKRKLSVVDVDRKDVRGQRGLIVGDMGRSQRIMLLLLESSRECEGGGPDSTGLPLALWGAEGLWREPASRSRVPSRRASCAVARLVRLKAMVLSGL